jgi:hypothetical protein
VYAEKGMRSQVAGAPVLATLRRLVNLTALSVADAGAARGNLSLPF